MVSIRRLEPQSKARIVFVTAHGLNQFEKECINAGADDFLTKPCKLEHLGARFERMLMLE